MAASCGIFWRAQSGILIRTSLSTTTQKPAHTTTLNFSSLTIFNATIEQSDMVSTAIRFVSGTKKSPLGTLYLQCHVKPGASRIREGVTAVTDATVELCVSAQAKEGEANKAVIKLLSGVLGIPKSDLTITQGLKSRDKTVAVGNIREGESMMVKIREQLEKALEDG